MSGGLPLPATPVALFSRPSREIAALLASGAPVYVPVNPVEYHGPHLPLHVDQLIARAVAAVLHPTLCSAAGASWPMLVTGDLEVGVDPTPGPGTRVTSLVDARRLVVEAAARLVDIGAQRVVFVTWHGGPLHGHAIQAGVDHLRAAGVAAVSPFNALLHRMVAGGAADAFAAVAAALPRAEDRALVSARPELDFHGGFSETSLALWCAPDSVDPCHRELPDCPAWPRSGALHRLGGLAAALGMAQAGRDLRFAADALGWTALRPFPGYTGAPRLATAAAGRAFVEAVLPGFAQAVLDVWDGGAPVEPPMGAVRWLTLGGRLPPTLRLGWGEVVRGPA